MRKEFLLTLLSAVIISAQPASPTWKEFSIGPPTRNQTGFSPQGMRAEGVPLRRAIARAYGLPEHRILGPDWVSSERYAITALVNAPEDFQPLFQHELTERFRMVAHREEKEVLAYVIRLIDGKPPEAGAAQTPARGVNSLHLSGQSVAKFASELADAIERPVFDETGLDGRFDFSLSWEYRNWGSLEKAVKEQLGMQLVPDKRKVDVLVIEHIEKLQFPK